MCRIGMGDWAFDDARAGPSRIGFTTMVTRRLPERGFTCRPTRPICTPHTIVRAQKMPLNPTPPPLDPTRYRSAAAHYEQGRVPYSPALIRRVAEVTGLAPRHRVLDLGCGPGMLARGFAPFAGEVVAIDPSTEMLTAARALAGAEANIRFLEGSSHTIGPNLGR